jgi:hypothetical protein
VFFPRWANQRDPSKAFSSWQTMANFRPQNEKARLHLKALNPEQGMFNKKLFNSVRKFTLVWSVLGA